MIFNLITKAKDLFYKNGKNVEEALDEVNNNISKFTKFTVHYLENNKESALGYLNNPTKINYIGANDACYNFIFVDNVGDSPLGGGKTEILGYTYGNGLHGFQMAFKYNEAPRWRNLIGGTWSGWNFVGKQSDIKAVETQLSNKILPQYKNYMFPTTGWYRVAKIPSSYGYMIDLQIIRTFANTPPEVHKISIGHAHGVSGFGFLNEASVGYELMIPKVRVTKDGANNQYIEVYFDYKSSGNNIVIMLSNQINSRLDVWSLIDMVPTEETVEGVTVLGEHEFSQNKSYESEIDTINTKISAIDSSLVAMASTEEF